MFYKIPLGIDLSKTSFRDRYDTETNAFIEYNEGFVGNDWEEITEEQFYEVVPRADENNNKTDKIEEIKNQLTQQDIIQAEQLSLQADILLNQQIIQENQAMILSNQADILLGGVTENV